MNQRIGSPHVMFLGFAVLFVPICIGCSNTANPTSSSSATTSTEQSGSRELPDASLSHDARDRVTDVAGTGVETSAEESHASESAESKAQPVPSKVAASMPKPPVAKPKEKVALAVPPAPEYVYEPTVVMSQRDSATCLVGVGDAFPEADLADLNNDTVAVKELLGERLTLVVFWSNASKAAREQIKRLPREVVEPFKNTGLGVVAVNVSDPAEQTIDILPAESKDGVALLLDTERVLFSKVATERIPRVYLLDQEGKILWLDIEYSRSTARDLSNAIHVFLGTKVPGDS